MVLCIIVGCGNKSGKSSQKKDSVVKFSRVPKIVKNEGEVIEEFNFCLHVCVFPHPHQSINMFQSFSVKHGLKLFFS